jgi:hypothetical protein
VVRVSYIDSIKLTYVLCIIYLRLSIAPCLEGNLECALTKLCSRRPEACFGASRLTFVASAAELYRSAEEMAMKLTILILIASL